MEVKSQVYGPLAEIIQKKSVTVRNCRKRVEALHFFVSITLREQQQQKKAATHKHSKYLTAGKKHRYCTELVQRSAKRQKRLN